jgi:hypothetical protein
MNGQSKPLFQSIQKIKPSKKVFDGLYYELSANQACAVGPPKLSGIAGPDPLTSFIVP